MGRSVLNSLVGRHRDSNAGPHACESGVVAITLRGPPPPVKLCWPYCLKRNTIFLFAFFLLLRTAPLPFRSMEEMVLRNSILFSPKKQAFYSLSLFFPVDQDRPQARRPVRHRLRGQLPLLHLAAPPEGLQGEDRALPGDVPEGDGGSSSS